MSDGLCKVRIAQFLGFLAVLTTCPLAHAQAVQTAQQRFHLQAYGMASYVKPDYTIGQPGTNHGGTIGVDLDGYRLLRHTSLGLDARYLASNGTVANESLFSGGPRVSFNAYRIQPYAVYEFGYGKATFNHGLDPLYQSDNTGVRSYGGGFDVMLTRYWGARADVLQQQWRFSHTQPYFHPLAVSVGVSYQVHLRSRTGPD